jgi:hypothetical protein
MICGADASTSAPSSPPSWPSSKQPRSVTERWRGARRSGSQVRKTIEGRGKSSDITRFHSLVGWKARLAAEQMDIGAGGADEEDRPNAPRGGPRDGSLFAVGIKLPHFARRPGHPTVVVRRPIA